MKTRLAQRKNVLVSIIFFFFLIFYSVAGISQTCSNWLYVPDEYSFFRVGDLDVPGNKITIEALINRTAPWNGIDVYQGDVVAKHEGPNDVNYLLRPSSAEITTTNGYYKTPTICPIQLNKTYHIAMVYNGSSLKFYRNGYLMSEIAASGNLVQNNFPTQIGLYFSRITRESFIGYINEVRIWNVARTQDEIKSYMAQSLPDPQNINGLLAYYTFDNLANKQGNTAWSGSLHGSAAINKNNPNCMFIADSCNIVPVCKTTTPDFTFSQNVCTSKTLQFNTSKSNVSTFQWEFGNGQKSSSSNPVVTYSAFGFYTVKLNVQYTNGCWDSVSKTISVFEMEDMSILDNRDTTICLGDSVLLRSKLSTASFCWQPGFGLESNSGGMIARPKTATTFTYTARVAGSNLVDNSNFNKGNAGFSSDYQFSESGVSNGSFSVREKVQEWNSGLAACSDHTTGTGHMMMVNGTNQQNARVWYQTINVKPHTNYIFSVWLQSLTNVNTAKLQFSINGNAVGEIINASTESCYWNQFYTLWNSGGQESITIAIVNMNQENPGNDFALDDIFFGEFENKTASIRVAIASNPEIDLGNDTTLCRGASVQLNAKTTRSSSINWTPALYLDSKNIYNPLSTPANNITYIATVLGQNGCSNRDTVMIKVLERPEIKLKADTVLCAGTSLLLNPLISNAEIINWHPNIYLSDPYSANPVFTPFSTTEYTLTATNGACATSGLVRVNINPLPAVTINDQRSICKGETVQLSASGGIAYNWTPKQYLSNNSIANPVAFPISSETYHVTVTDENSCKAIDSVKVEVRQKPVFDIQPAIQTICYGDSLLLKASGGDVYKWDLVDNFILIDSANIKAFPLKNTVYKVHIRDLICNLEDTLYSSVHVNPIPEVKISKSNDVDCAKTTTQLIANGGNKYEWYPAINLSNNLIPNPIASPDKTSIYKVKVSSLEGCFVVDSIQVNVKNTGNDEYYVPTAFTPNGDGKNDCFGVKYWGKTNNFTFSIYNRWGEKIFSTNSFSDCWSGRYKGIDQPAGTYVYYITAETFCGSITKKGTVNLLR